MLVQNDVRVGGYAEFRLGAGRGYRDIIAAFVGTGIGGCVILGGEIVTGSTGNAGELGHMIVKAGGPRCGCGARGCMEALASKTAMQRRITKADPEGDPHAPRREDRPQGGPAQERRPGRGRRRQDPVALKAVQRAAHFLGLGLGGLVNVFGPEIVIIGGGVVDALGDPWVDLVRTAARSQIITDPDGHIKIERAVPGRRRRHPRRRPAGPRTISRTS